MMTAVRSQVYFGKSDASLIIPPTLPRETQLVAISMAPPTPKTLSRQRTAALPCSNTVVIYTHYRQRKKQDHVFITINI